MSILEQQLKSSTIYLRILLVMSMIGSGFMLLNSLLMSMFLPTIRQFAEASLSAMPVEMQAMYEVSLSIPRICYVLMTILYGLSLVGVILMWNFRQNGWHCYTLAQLLLLVVPVLFMGKAFLGIGDVMMSLLFVGIYFGMLRGIHKIMDLIESEKQSNSNQGMTMNDDSQEQSE